jgi:hypothetical protein
MPQGNEVFNVSRNMYTYGDASAVCTALGAKLATYEQVKSAYENGADWCNYGWVKGQMAVYPTQEKTWKKLQEGPSEYRTACGNPGINGGYFDNAGLRFGVNCYGKKPAPSESDKALMKANVEIKRPESKEDADLKAKMKVWQENADKFLLVNSFNKTNWSEDV